mgnify:FL=1
MLLELTPGKDVFDSRRKIILPTQLDSIRSALPSDTQLVVAEGGFDIIHAGHVSYLEASRQLGDALVVLVCSDISLKHKGFGRPVQTQDARARIVASLQCVDFVVPIGHDQNTDALDKLQASVYTRGIDYNWDTSLPLIKAYLIRTGLPIAYVGNHGNVKTSGIVKKIKENEGRT